MLQPNPEPLRICNSGDCSAERVTSSVATQQLAMSGFVLATMYPSSRPNVAENLCLFISTALRTLTSFLGGEGLDLKVLES
jgi:hypothetical protein